MLVALNGTGTTAPGLPTIGLNLVLLLIMSWAMASFYRSALSTGPIVLAVGMDHVRAGLAALGVAFIFFLCFSILSLLMVLFLGGVGASTGWEGRAQEPPVEAFQRFMSEGGFGLVVAFAISFTSLVAFLIYFLGRLAFAHPATLAEGRVRILSNIHETRGHGVRLGILIGTILVIGFFLFIVSSEVSKFLLVGTLSPVEPGASQGALSQPRAVSLVAEAALSGFVLVGFCLAPLAGSLASVWQRTRVSPPA
jgi:hypothetical protein